MSSRSDDEEVAYYGEDGEALDAPGSSLAAVIDAGGVVIDGNVVASYGDQKSWIRVNNSTNAQLSDNQAATYVLTGNTNLTQSGNAIIAALTDNGANALAAWRNAACGLTQACSFSTESAARQRGQEKVQEPA